MAATAFSEFHLRQFTFEIRYSDAYLIWDRAGALWRDASFEFGDLSSDKITPGTQVFHAGDRYALNASTTTAFVIDYEGHLRTTKAPKFISTVIRVLEIGSLTRIGVRLHYVRKCKDEGEAAKIARGLSLVTYPTERLFDVSSNLVKPIFHIEASDDEFGYSARIVPQSRKAQFQPPPEASRYLTPQIAEQFEIIIDVDLFTMNPISSDMFDAQSWLTKWAKVADNDVPKLIGLAGKK